MNNMPEPKWKRVCKSAKLKMNKVKGKAIGTKGAMNRSYIGA